MHVPRVVPARDSVDVRAQPRAECEPLRGAEPVGGKLVVPTPLDDPVTELEGQQLVVQQCTEPLAGLNVVPIFTRSPKRR